MFRGFESLSLHHLPLQNNGLRRISCATPHSTPQFQNGGVYLLYKVYLMYGRSNINYYTLMIPLESELLAKDN